MTPRLQTFVCNTTVASMQKLIPSAVPIEDRLEGISPSGESDEFQSRQKLCSVGGSISTKSAENLILVVRDRSCQDLGASASIIQIVESLAWPFIARRSLKHEWFTDVELNRFVKSLRETASRLVQIESEDNREQTFCKFWLDTYLCQVMHDPQRPAREDWITCPLFSGWCLNFIKRAVARRDLRFIYSLQKGSKRYWPSLGEVKKEAALRKHAFRLSNDHGSLTLELSDAIRSASFEVFSSLQPHSSPFHRKAYMVQDVSKYTKFMPSGSACLQASRREGGALKLVQKLDLPSVLETTDESRVIGKLPALSLSVNNWRRSTYSDVLDKAIGSLGVSDRVERTVVDSNGNLLKTGEVVDHCAAFDVEVVAIPEPGKFRIITKGDGYLYTALQPLQGAVLDCWKKHPASTMLHDDLLESVQKLDRNVKLPFWCSVDYEAATDLLKKDAILAAYAALHSVPLGDLGWLSFEPGIAKYPFGEVWRSEGQLMGHPLSFPLLCVINLAVYRLSIVRWMQDVDGRPSSEVFRRRRIAESMYRNVLVNGDDMLFKCEHSFYSVFLETAHEAGFKISQGKNYLSPDACMINSQTFIRSKAGNMARKGYLNLKLVYGTSLKEGESATTPTQVGKELSKMVSQVHWANCAIPFAFKRWKDDWFGPVYRPNWYLPVHLGGFGVSLKYGPSDIGVTKSQRSIAARFIANPALALYRRKGISLPVAKLAGALAKWQLIPDNEKLVEELENDLSFTKELDDDWLARLAYAFRASRSPTSEVSDRILIHKFRPESRLKPLSFAGLLRYWDAHFYAH